MRGCSVRVKEVFSDGSTFERDVYGESPQVAMLQAATQLQRYLNAGRVPELVLIGEPLEVEALVKQSSLGPAGPQDSLDGMRD